MAKLEKGVFGGNQILQEQNTELISLPSIYNTASPAFQEFQHNQYENSETFFPDKKEMKQEHIRERVSKLYL